MVDKYSIQNHIPDRTVTINESLTNLIESTVKNAVLDI